MRVAFVTFEYPPLIIGVTGVHILYVTEELAKTGHQIVVITRALANRGGGGCEKRNFRFLPNSAFIFKIFNFSPICLRS